MRSKSVFAGLALGIGIAAAAHADEPVLGFLVATDLLPKDGMEFEQQLTWRHQKAGGDFDLLNSQTEFSYGVTDSVQFSPSIIFDYTHAYHNATDGTTVPAEQFSNFFPNPNAAFDHGLFEGVAFETIWRVQSPYTDPIGIAFLLEPEFGPHLTEVEVKAIFQKNFYDDRLVFVANITWAPEIRNLDANPYADPGEVAARPNTNIETDVNFGIGVSYRFSEDWSAGYEFQNEREINGWAVFSHRQWMGSGYYTGPTIHYGGEHFFATLTWWQQLPIAKNYMDPSVIKGGYDDDVDFEHTRVRLKFGYYF